MASSEIHRSAVVRPCRYPAPRNRLVPFKFCQTDVLSGIPSAQTNDDVAKFAHVAGERIVRPTRRRDASNETAVPSRRTWSGNDLRARASLRFSREARDLNRQNTQAVVQVVAEPTGANLLHKVAVCGGDNPRSGLPYTRFANPVVLAIFQHTQKLRL